MIRLGGSGYSVGVLKIGCGVSSFREGKWFSTLYTCDYGPNGNFSLNGYLELAIYAGLQSSTAESLGFK